MPLLAQNPGDATVGLQPSRSYCRFSTCAVRKCNWWPRHDDSGQGWKKLGFLEKVLGFKVI